MGMGNPGTLQQATFKELEQAVALNHRELFRKESLTLGGTLHSVGDLSWTSGGTNSPSMITFPVLSDEQADSALDGLMDFYWVHRPAGAGCWSLEPPRPNDLGVRLLARGFQPGWRPCWMALDLGEMRSVYEVPKGLLIRADHATNLSGIKNLPYAQVVIPAVVELEMEGQWVRFLARLNGRIVGQSVVFLTTGIYGVAGIYHVGVLPRARGKGIGKELTLAACRYARDKGYRYAVLNATDAGRRVYEQLGFAVTGEGWTWWLKMDKYLARRPQQKEVRLAEAIGRGDIAALEGLRSLFAQGELDRMMTNGMTWMELAVHCRQPDAAEWLVEGGAPWSVLDAWDLGWKDRAEQLLREDPERADNLYGEWSKTLLHFAAERNDAELAVLVLSASPDLSVRDSAYRSTPLDWANHFGHADIVRLLEQAGR